MHFQKIFRSPCYVDGMRLQLTIILTMFFLGVLFSSNADLPEEREWLRHVKATGCTYYHDAMQGIGLPHDCLGLTPSQCAQLLHRPAETDTPAVYGSNGELLRPRTQSFTNQKQRVWLNFDKDDKCTGGGIIVNQKFCSICNSHLHSMPIDEVNFKDLDSKLEEFLSH